MDSSSSLGSRPVVSRGPGSVSGPNVTPRGRNGTAPELIPSSPEGEAAAAAAAAEAPAAAATRSLFCARYSAHTLAMCLRRSLFRDVRSEDRGARLRRAQTFLNRQALIYMGGT